MFDYSIPSDGFLVADNNLPYKRSPRLLDKVRNVIHCKHQRGCMCEARLQAVVVRVRVKIL